MYIIPIAKQDVYEKTTVSDSVWMISVFFKVLEVFLKKQRIAFLYVLCINVKDIWKVENKREVTHGKERTVNSTPVNLESHPLG